MRVETASESVAALLRAHPRIESVAVADGPLVQFESGSWRRRISEGAVGDVFGLIELMDNNPIVCADEVGVPSPITTLALLALGPLIAAGIVRDDPVILASADFPAPDLDPMLRDAGWMGSWVCHASAQELAGVLAATVTVPIATPLDLDEIDDLFDERYSRSLYVKREESADWDVSLVKGKPYACYRLRIAPEDGVSLLTVLVMADLNGKAGAAQVVHTLNVMCGFEESLGL
jgi:N-acetyl-gamma-glutamylphosphate reductase